MIEQSTFVDWLYVAQRHVGELPMVGDGVRVLGESFEMMEVEGEKFVVVRPGEEVRYSCPSKSHRGSHDTNLRVRCDGSTVQLSGNVGRFDRPNNVWNYGFQDTIEKASQIVNGLSLPSFFAGNETIKETVSKRDYDLGLWTEWSGAVVRELHVTRNYFAGNESLAIEVMKFFNGQRAARLSKGRHGNETVQFGDLAKKGKAFHKALVVYRKADEMLAHAKGVAKKAEIRKSPEYQMARDLGLIRVECKWGAHFLRDNGLRYVGGVTMGKLISIFERETGFLMNATPDQAARVVSDLPNKIKAAAMLWLRGEDLRSIYSRATYFRMVKTLRDYGIDASESRTGGQSGETELQALLDALPRFDLKVLPVPEWYGLPEIRKAA